LNKWNRTSSCHASSSRSGSIGPSPDDHAPDGALAPRSRRANIRANKPVPERRTQLHAVADVPPDGRPGPTTCTDPHTTFDPASQEGQLERAIQRACRAHYPDPRSRTLCQNVERSSSVSGMPQPAGDLIESRSRSRPYQATGTSSQGPEDSGVRRIPISQSR